MGIIDTTTGFGKRVAEQVEGEEVVWLTTVGADGTPHPSAVWFNFNTDRLGAHLTTFTGTARLDGVAPTPEEMAAYDAKYAASITRIGYTPEQFHAAYSVPLRVTPEKLRGF